MTEIIIISFSLTHKLPAVPPGFFGFQQTTNNNNKIWKTIHVYI